MLTRNDGHFHWMNMSEDDTPDLELVEGVLDLHLPKARRSCANALKEIAPKEAENDLRHLLKTCNLRSFLWLVLAISPSIFKTHFLTRRLPTERRLIFELVCSARQVCFIDFLDQALKESGLKSLNDVFIRLESHF